jgi:arylsulfatase A-like enzyme
MFLSVGMRSGVGSSLGPAGRGESHPHVVPPLKTSRRPASRVASLRPGRLFAHVVHGLLVLVAVACACRPVRAADAPAAVPVAASAAAPARPAARNVVLIVSDDQHWRDYGFMRHPHLRTPHLDRLARESLVFPRGYVTSSLCCPSLASIITGRLPHEHRVVGNDPPELPGVPRKSPPGQAAFAAGRERMNAHLAEWPTLPGLLGQAGFASLQTGKWWQGDFSRGGFTEGMTKGARHGDEGLAIGRKSMEPLFEFVGRQAGAGKPFFIWYAPMLPHDPHDPPADLVEHYSSRAESVHVARYWGNVERFDRTVGELLDHLDRTGLSRDTLVVYVTDNGWIQDSASPRFAPRSKLSPYDGGLRTPIMLRQPGTVLPGTSDEVASAIDIMPTVLAACGVRAPAGLPGVNLLDAAAVAARRQVFGECYTHTLVDLDDPVQSLLWRWTVRDRVVDGVRQSWKLILPTATKPFPVAAAGLVDPESRGRHEQGAIELYDLAVDPDETKNLAAARPDLVGELTRSLDARWSITAKAGAAAPAAAPAPASTDTAAGPRRPPNLLVFLADDLGAHDLGCTGSTFYRTPTIDRLAADGMRFTRGYAACPVCSPTRAALVTGRHPARVRITNFIAGNRRGKLLPADYLHSLPDEEVTIAERLRDRGYACGVFGKWHLGPPAEIERHGFAVQGSTKVGPGSGPPDDPLHARAIAAAAAEFIEAHRDRPFFCYVPLHSPHVPLVTRPDLATEEGRRAVGVGPRFDPPPPHPGDPVTRAVQDHPVYAGMIREMDEAVATVLAALERTGLAGDTLVVFSSDNGGLSTAEGAPTSNLPLRAGKGFVYEGGIRVPLLVRWPGVVAAGGTSAVPVTTLDIAATLLDAAGCLPGGAGASAAAAGSGTAGAGAAEAPDAAVLDGTSLRPLLAGKGSPPARDLIWHYPHYSNQGGRPAAALIAGDGPQPGAEKLVEHFEDGRFELFDLAADPGEYRDLSAERPARAAELKARLAAWRMAVAAAMPKPNPEPVEPFGPQPRR